MKELKILKSYLETKKSLKSGNEYTVLVIQFENNYKIETFLNNDQLYILKNLTK